MILPRSFVQSSGLALAVALLAGFTPPPAKTPAPAPSTGLVAATPAPGDVTPGPLFTREVREGIGPGRVSVSNPTSPKQPLAAPLAPETRRSRSTVFHVAPGSSATQLSLPIDTPDDAWVMVIPKARLSSEGEAALRDVTLANPSGLRVDKRAERAAHDELGVDPERMKASGVTKPISMMRLSRDMGSGAYQVQVGARAAATGVAIEVRLPTSPIELSLTPSAMQFFPGEEATVQVGLASDAALAGVRYEAWLYNPRFERVRQVPVVQVGQQVRARVSDVLSERDETGTWGLEVRATGTSGGKAFDRLAQTAFGFAVPTAHIASAGRPRLVRGADGKVTALELDVVVESQSLDRYEVSGTLVATDKRGVERPVAEAQVTDQLDAGTYVLTLHFDAGHVALSHLEGSYALRGLQLYSLGTNTLYHRMGRGMELRMPSVRADELAASEPTPAIQAMMDAGEFNFAQ